VSVTDLSLDGFGTIWGISQFGTTVTTPFLFTQLIIKPWSHYQTIMSMQLQ